MTSSCLDSEIKQWYCRSMGGNENHFACIDVVLVKIIHPTLILRLSCFPEKLGVNNKA